MAASRVDTVVVRLPTASSPVSLRRLGVRRAMPVLAVTGTTTTIEATLAEQLLPALRAAVGVAIDHEVAIVTGGTDAGVFHLLGLAVSAAPTRPPAVVGVAPDGRLARGGAADADVDADVELAPVDPQLSALVRVPGETWGDETSTLSRVVGAIAGEQRVVVLLVGGGDVSRAELLEHLSRGRSVVVLRGSGRLADEVASSQVASDDVDLRALLSSGDVHVVGLDEPPEVLARLLAEQLASRRPPSLRQRSGLLSVLPRARFRPQLQDQLLAPGAAARYPLLRQRIEDADGAVLPAFAACDVEAQLEQNRHRWFTVLAIAGGLFTTVFGALQAWLQSVAWPGVAVATLGAATSALITVSRRQDSLRRYLSARLRAERLRSLYFEHLAQAPEPDATRRQEQLRSLEVRVVEQQRGPVSL